MTGKITFHDFVAQVSTRAGIPRHPIHDFIKQLAAVIDAGLIRDGRVRIARLGTFRLKRVAETTGINPQTRESILIPEHTRVLFKPASALATRVNREYNHLKPEPIMVQNTDSPNATIPNENNPTEEPVQQAVAESPKQPSGQKLPPMRTIIIAAAAVVAVVIIALLIFSGGEEEVVTPTPAPTEAPAAEPVQPEMAEPAEPVTPTPTETEFPEEAQEPVTDVRTAPAEPSEPPTVSPPPMSIMGSRAHIHLIRRSDKLWNLAQVYYGKSDYWPLIFQANRKLVYNPDLLFIGLDLIIPSLEGSPGALAESDSTNLAKGYADAYESYLRRGKPDAEQYLRESRRFK